MKSTIPSTRNNNIVAESDLKAAIAALQDKLNAKIAASDDPVQRQLLTDCSNSLTAKIHQSVQPVADDAFHVYLSRYKDDKITCPSDDDETVKAVVAVPSSAAASTTTQIFEFEEEELIDQAAAAHVKELREEARTQAVIIQSLRATTLNRAVAIAERQVKLWLLSDAGQQQQSNGGDENKSKTMKLDASTMLLLEKHKASVEDMKSSLNIMQTALQEAGTVLPAKLQSFQATLQEIEASLNKQGGCSQIEKAIYSREKQVAPMQSDDDDDDTTTTMDLRQLAPDQRLANLLCRDD